LRPFLFNARITAIRACIMKSRPSAASIRTPAATRTRGCFRSRGGTLDKVPDCVSQGDELLAIGQDDRRFELLAPAAISNSPAVHA
jgi:hypothetical protein